ncbi:MAG: Fe-S cluster assembly protein SufD [Bacteroidales bacterium]|nr:Fe-S cluster assembly protein SufD [Bacteroidales bacterium]
MDIEFKLADVTENFVSLFEANKNILLAEDNKHLNKIREEAIKSLAKLKIPGKKSEDYKYTPIGDLLFEEIEHVFSPKEIEFDIEDIFSCDVPEIDTQGILILNGFFLNQGEEITKYENGVIIGSLKAAMKNYPELVNNHFAKYSDYKKDPIAALNTAFAQDGVFLYVPKNVKHDKSIQIIHLLLANEDQLVQHRNLFILEEGAEANVLICDHSLSIQKFVTNSVTEIFSDKNSTFNITRVQNEHNQSVQITNTYIHQEQDSVVTSNTISLHGGIIRNNIKVNMEGENCENNCLGLFFADKEQIVDNFIYINHLKPNCTSNQLYKGILDDTARGAFTGRIHVWPDAQKTLAYQKNNNILMSDDAKMNTKPQLEIYADDVKCSHGATVGQLDEEAVFYLQSRGISERESRLLLMYAFADEVISKIKLPALKERMNDLVDKRLRGELSRCNNCKMNCR